jgi:hypothetical protein
MRQFVGAVAIPVALAASVSVAYAQGADAGAAESLFQAGKALLEQKNYAQACPKLAESYRLDPGTGTLLALALCHEGEGRLASAWGEFAEAGARSRREGRSDREELARQRMSALESRLPMLTITVASGAEKIDHLEIKRDGIVVGSGSWATAVPVDPGHHHVEASAPGYKTFSQTVTLATDAARETIFVPVLERAPELPEQPLEPHEPGGSSGRPGGALRYTGLAVGGLGVVGVVIGSIFGVRAIGLNNDSKHDCDAQNVCGPAGTASRHDAQSAGDVSTVAFVAGGVLVAGGVTMFVLGQPHSSGATAVRAAPIVSEREFGIRLEGAF